MTARRSPVKDDPADSDQIERALLWQGVGLEFSDLPLGAIVAAINRYNRIQLVIGDEATAAIKMGGSLPAPIASRYSSDCWEPASA